jgi:hypothetical protein
MTTPDFDHWNVGVGVPEATTDKLAGCPSVTVWARGWVVMIGAAFTTGGGVDPPPPPPPHAKIRDSIPIEANNNPFDMRTNSPLVPTIGIISD